MAAHCPSTKTVLLLCCYWTLQQNQKGETQSFLSSSHLQVFFHCLLLAGKGVREKLFSGFYTLVIRRGKCKGRYGNKTQRQIINIQITISQLHMWELKRQIYYGIQLDWNAGISNRLDTPAGRRRIYMVQGEKNNTVVNKDSEQWRINNLRESRCLPWILEEINLKNRKQNKTEIRPWVWSKSSLELSHKNIMVNILNKRKVTWLQQRVSVIV